MRRPITFALLVLALLAGSGCGGEEESTTVFERSSGDYGPVDLPPEEDSQLSPEALAEYDEACGHTSADTACGLTSDELHAINNQYSQRMAFSGDEGEAAAHAEAVHAAVGPLVEREQPPTAEEVGAIVEAFALDRGLGDVQTSGHDFAVGIEGGCLVGSVTTDAVTVTVDGYINDGGCLTAPGH